MSVQLIVYPQTYEGEYNAITTVPGQALVDGLNFTTVDTSSDLVVSTANHVQEAVDYYNPIMPPNTWSRYHTAGATVPNEQTNQLSFNITTGSGGIMQRITNLTVGAVYEIKLDVFGSLGAYPKVYIYSGTILQNSATITTVSGAMATYQFTATSSSHTFVLDLTTASGTNLQIFESISIMQAGLTPSDVLQMLGDGQVICDLYEDEDIPLSLSVDDFKNVAEKVQSYSKAFKLPATKRNNRIFDDMFEITRTAQGTLAFNPYNKTECVLKQDGFILFKGYLKMLDINDKDGEISYNVNLYSEVVALADILKDRTFSLLDFTELEHLYNWTEIKNSWAGTLGLTNPLPVGTYAGTSGASTTDVLKYPFVDWSHQYPQNTDGAVLSNLESTFRPFIKLKYLINRIFEVTPFTWESTFFDDEIFNNLYMDFNWGADDTPNDFSITGFGQYKTGDADNFATTGWTNVDLTTDQFTDEFGFAANVFTCPAGQDNSTFNLVTSIRTRNVLNNATIQFRWLKNGTTVINPSTTYSSTGMAAATVTLSTASSGGFGSVVNITIADGGNYASAPTVTMTTNGMNAGGFTGTAVMTGTAVTSVTIDTPGGSYVFWDELQFNGVSVSSSISTYISSVSEPLNPGETLQLQFKASANNCIKQDNLLGGMQSVSQSPTQSCNIHGSVGIQGVTTSIILQALRGELGQWDFLKGIMTMFNLVSLPDEDNPNNIKFETYADIFHTDTSSGSINDLTLSSRSIQHDWTDRIDVAEMKLTPLTDLNKNTIFKFVEDEDDYCFNVYKLSVESHLYGSKKFDASLASNGLATVLEGTKEVVAEPFAATVVKPLELQFPDFITPAIYSYNADDGTSEGFDNSPRIMFNNGVKSLTSCTYYVPTQNGVIGEPLQTKFLQFSHLSVIPSSEEIEDFNFGECQYFPGVGETSTNNLYNLYWSPYYNELYNPDTRLMTIKVNLSPAIINTFKFNDTVIIKNREFRVNKISYKPNDLATVEFILIP